MERGGSQPVNSDHKIISNAVGNALSGKGAHAATSKVFAGLDWKVAGARPAGVPHSLFQLLNHLIYWQDWVVEWFTGKTPPIPKHASGSWPGATSPASRKEWSQAVRRFQAGLKELDRRSRDADLCLKRGKSSGLGMLHAIASHNSYHAGQAVILRQAQGKWPPSAGLTW